MMRQQFPRALRQVRNFSTTPRQHAAEVKRLGVIGAGQMVSSVQLAVYKHVKGDIGS